MLCLLGFREKSHGKSHGSRTISVCDYLVLDARIYRKSHEKSHGKVAKSRWVAGVSGLSH